MSIETTNIHTKSTLKFKLIEIDKLNGACNWALVWKQQQIGMLIEWSMLRTMTNTLMEQKKSIRKSEKTVETQSSNRIVHQKRDV